MSTEPPPTWDQRQPWDQTQYPPPAPQQWGQPQYGAGPPATGKQPPRKAWFVIGAALIVAGLVAISFGGYSMAKVLQASPGANDTFENNGATTVDLQPGEHRMIYIFAGEDGLEPHDIDCVVTSVDTEATPEITPVGPDVTVNQWQAVFTFTTDRPGSHEVTCTGMESDRFGVGGEVSMGTFGGAFVAIIAGILAAGLGLITLIIVGLLRYRRRGHQPGWQ
ncbi:hypothetical protein LTT02_25885 [Mycolicibacterium smegmatis]|uniref:hypothetical protein n=1 Tax=Mycolicibacterium smegmatis TaxID=1772 RepID=UPI0005D99C03|nr:hypothetical protein [Mycolicibacterium smegmatis]MDF1898176.1 hypothetical protein [Mycolicibacterium smegmatis]MDF1906823.1 hypothetical protein [Mycolicibacterium smegmatis]MDF1919368.1 hypothetical protein [Mycolicibacterium smegmatis]MDF1925555.1 hypothetical protein [Mycolicibacterium smegmatis]UGT74164.1 hypothetical protein LTT02_25885 [Mycolicibacterium smegmatis]